MSYPLDATKEYTLGKADPVMTLIGVAYNGRPVAGVLHQPFVGERGRSIWGVVGADGGRGRVAGVQTATPAAAHGGLVVAVTESHATPVVERAIAKLSPSKVLRVGGCGYKVMVVIEGTADLYMLPNPGTKLWDTCGPEAVLRAVGGVLTDMHGRDLVYTTDVDVRNTDGVVVSLRDREAHSHFITLLQRN
eukprot:m51a1_g12897 putative 3 (2 ) -bisphosphate nucleotidase 1 (191) ;mRNA; r:2362-3217